MLRAEVEIQTHPPAPRSTKMFRTFTQGLTKNVLRVQNLCTVRTRTLRQTFEVARIRSTSGGLLLLHETTEAGTVTM